MKKVPLSLGRYAIVDDEDYPIISRHTWHCRKSDDGKRFYAATHFKRKACFMHRLIVGNKAHHKMIDHVNCNGLDNRKENLRICNYTQNLANSRLSQRNTSGYKGVCWDKDTDMWISRIRFIKTNINLGRFYDKEEAAYVYDQAAYQLFGEFARTNFL